MKTAMQAYAATLGVVAAGASILLVAAMLQAAGRVPDAWRAATEPDTEYCRDRYCEQNLGDRVRTFVSTMEGW